MLEKVGSDNLLWKFETRDLVCEHNASDALWIPEQLVHIIITNDVIMITFSLHKLSINELIAWS